MNFSLALATVRRAEDLERFLSPWMLRPTGTLSS